MPESGVTKHNYLFCQFVNPARGHEGDRCDCFDTPSQRRTTLAKQRLARLRANREINRASTSNDPESAVASDPAVTLAEIQRFRELEHSIIDTQCRIDFLQAQVWGAKQAQNASQVRLAATRLDRTVGNLRTLPNMGRRNFGEFRQNSQKRTFNRQ